MIGSGAIGCEFASFYSDMGAKVTIVEMLDRILPVEDHEVSAFVHKAFEKQGMTILHLVRGRAASRSSRAARSSRRSRARTARSRIASTATSSSRSASSPNTEEIGLEALGVATERGHVKIDGMCRTNVDGLWAIGDITGAPWLAHKASHEGIIAVEAIAAKNGNKDVHPHAMDVRNIPGCTYSRPQVASRRL